MGKLNSKRHLQNTQEQLRILEEQYEATQAETRQPDMPPGAFGLAYSPTGRGLTKKRRRRFVSGRQGERAFNRAQIAIIARVARGVLN